MKMRTVPVLCIALFAAFLSFIILHKPAVAIAPQDEEPVVPAFSFDGDCTSPITGHTNLLSADISDNSVEYCSENSGPIGPDGGCIFVTTGGGTTYKLTVLAGTLDQTANISLQPIIDTSGLPFSSSTAIGITIVSDVDLLAEPILLRIITSSSLDLTTLIGFTYRGNQTAAMLYPFILDSSDYLLYLHQFGSYGVTQASETEIDALLAIPPTDATDKALQELAPLVRDYLVNGWLDEEALGLSMDSLTTWFTEIASELETCIDCAEVRCQDHINLLTEVVNTYKTWQLAVSMLSLDGWDELVSPDGNFLSRMETAYDDIIEDLSSDCSLATGASQLSLVMQLDKTVSLLQMHMALDATELDTNDLCDGALTDEILEMRIRYRNLRTVVGIPVPFVVDYYNGLGTELQEIVTPPCLAWTTSDPSIAQISSSGIINGINPGTVTISATSIQCDSGSTDKQLYLEDSVSVKIVSSPYVSSASSNIPMSANRTSTTVGPFERAATVTWNYYYDTLPARIESNCKSCNDNIGERLSEEWHIYWKGMAVLGQDIQWNQVVLAYSEEGEGFLDASGRCADYDWTPTNPCSLIRSGSYRDNVISVLVEPILDIDNVEFSLNRRLGVDSVELGPFDSGTVRYTISHSQECIPCYISSTPDFCITRSYHNVKLTGFDWSLPKFPSPRRVYNDLTSIEYEDVTDICGTKWKNRTTVIHSAEIVPIKVDATMLAEPERVGPGDTITYTINVTNTRPVHDTFEIHAPIPTGTEFSHIISEHPDHRYEPFYANGEVTWIDKLGEFERLHLIYAVTVNEDASDTIVNKATIKAGEQELEVEAKTELNSCEVPFLFQGDRRWRLHPILGCNPLRCATIKECGCTLTSTTMVFNTYGANLTPDELSDKMFTWACPFLHRFSAKFSQNKARFVAKVPFSYERMDTEINQNKRPVVLGMYYLDKNKKKRPHWVVVWKGHGKDPANYLIHDPGVWCGSNRSLSTLSSKKRKFTTLVIYESIDGCTSLTSKTYPCEKRGHRPIRARSGTEPASGTDTVVPEIDLQMTAGGADWFSGTVDIYRMTQLTGLIPK